VEKALVMRRVGPALDLGGAQMSWWRRRAERWRSWQAPTGFGSNACAAPRILFSSRPVPPT